MELWGSHIESQHPQNIRANGKVFIVVYDSTVAPGCGEGVYIQAECVELFDLNEIVAAHRLIQTRRQAPYWNIEEVQPISPVHLFKATPECMWMNADGEKDQHYIDTRVDVCVPELFVAVVTGCALAR